MEQLRPFERELRSDLRISDGTVSICLDLYTDDYRKQAYLDVHCNWIDRDFSSHHTALAVKHFGTNAHTGQNIQQAVSDILAAYGLSVNETPATTDHASNIVAALKNGVRLDCVCHRLQLFWKMHGEIPSLRFLRQQSTRLQSVTCADLQNSLQAFRSNCLCH